MRTQREIERSRNTRLKRQLQRTVEATFSHFEHNPHIDFELTLQSDLRQMMGRIAWQEKRRLKFGMDDPLAERIYATAQRIADIDFPARPDDWVLGKDGRYVWDENVTSSTDTDLDGRKYIGSGKYDAYNDAFENRNAWDKFWGYGPKNVDWRSYYSPILRNISLDAIAEEKNRYWIKGGENNGDWGRNSLPDVESTYRIDFKGQVATNLDITFPVSLTIDGTAITGVGNYKPTTLSQQYITAVDYAANIIKRSNFERGNAYSLILGHTNNQNIIVVTFKNQKDFHTVKSYIFD